MSTGPHLSDERTILVKLLREYHDPVTIEQALELLNTEKATNLTFRQINSLLANMSREDNYPIRRVGRGVYQYHSQAQGRQDIIKVIENSIAPKPPVEVIAEDSNLIVVKYKGKMWIGKPSV